MKSIQLGWRPGTARFEASGRSGASVVFEAPGEPDDMTLDDGPHGSAAGPSPAELLLVAGAGCATWVLVEILRKKRQDVTAVDVAVAGAQQPDGYLNVHYTVVEPDKRFSNLRDCHELYCAGHLIEGALAYAEATGEQLLMHVLSFVDGTARRAEAKRSIRQPAELGRQLAMQLK